MSTNGDRAAAGNENGTATLGNVTADVSNTDKTAKSGDHSDFDSTAAEENGAGEATEQPKANWPVSWAQWTQKLAEGPRAAAAAVRKVTILGTQFETTDWTPIARAIRSKLWLTYRTGFEPIPKSPAGPHPLAFLNAMIFNRNPFSSTFTNMHSFVDNDNFTTDVGWGCMIRTSQALLANTLQMLVLGKAFQYEAHNEQHNHIVDLFRDTSTAPFSLHNFIQVANEAPLQVRPGQWFGPSAASLSIQRLCKFYGTSEGRALPKLEVLISESGDLYDDQVKSMVATDPVLVLLPIRLGIDRTNQFYFSSILELLEVPQAVGIAGGRPSSSFYFFGYEGTDLLYLDPHYPQSISEAYASYHTDATKRLPIAEIDPSMMIGLLLRDADDYEQLKGAVVSTNKIVHFHDTKTRKERVGSVDRPKVATDDFVDLGDFEFDDEPAAVGEPGTESLVEVEAVVGSDEEVAVVVGTDEEVAVVEAIDEEVAVTNDINEEPEPIEARRIDEEPQSISRSQLLDDESA